METLSIILALCALVVPVAAIVQRTFARKGIGWQFIRFTVIAIALPIAALLALNNALNEAAAAIIAGALGYAFGKKDE